MAARKPPLTQPLWRNAVAASYRQESLQSELTDAKQRLAAFESLDTIKPTTIPKYDPVAGDAIALALLSDVHAGESVDPVDIPGAVNIYNPEVCERRLVQFAQRVIYLVRAQRHMCKIEELCLGMLGDMMTGYLHDDQRESNHLSPNEEVLALLNMLIGVIDYLLAEGNFKRIMIPCTLGNHGRSTVKMRVKTSAKNSWEWLLYQVLAKHYADKGEKRVEFFIAEGHHLYLRLFDFTVRFHHGDGIQYNGGVGGITIPLNKAIAQWNTVQVADLDVMGHWHQCMDLGNAITNGSVIGFNSYSLIIKAKYEPPRQAFALIDRKRGKTLFSHIFTDYLPKGFA